ncbi:hypothetical protein BT63DRAFT_424775 [Microthyrium microscopicum]|uniref:Uncharacterized protein n=1 Tax=Microthyrium microscopicum TaxID=703497 RepID=A0A6A6UBT1_9PEZI|nr:hypothetical protein BT63DRAFT_424775 [Microthyrium microscopicum]
MSSEARPNWAPDPATTNRRDYTAAVCSQQLAANANQDFIKEMTLHRRLANALARHDAMAPNLTQNFNVPANKKSRVYFMWDFVIRTIGFLNILGAQDVGLPADMRTEMQEDILSRHQMVVSLVLDDSGKANAMFQGDTTPWGDEVVGIVREMEQD